MISDKFGKTAVKYLVAFSIFCLHAASPVHAQPESIRIATFGQGGPMEKAVAARLTECYNKLGIQVEFVNLPGNRALQESNSGRLDGELMRKAELGGEYPNLLQIMVPLATTNTVAFALDKSIDLDKSWASLKEHTFSYETGTKVIEQNTRGFNTGHAEQNIKTAFRQMLNGRVELIVIDEQAGLQLVKEMGLEGKVHMLTTPISMTPLYHYLHKKHADLATKLEALLRKNQ